MHSCTFATGPPRKTFNLEQIALTAGPAESLRKGKSITCRTWRDVFDRVKRLRLNRRALALEGALHVFSFASLTRILAGSLAGRLHFLLPTPRLRLFTHGGNLSPQRNTRKDVRAGVGATRRQGRFEITFSCCCWSRVRSPMVVPLDTSCFDFSLALLCWEKWTENVLNVQRRRGRDTGGRRNRDESRPLASNVSTRIREGIDLGAGGMLPFRHLLHDAFACAHGSLECALNKRSGRKAGGNSLSEGERKGTERA
mmetsp:Transcript_9833/g.19033  ORF Transcript_9833/g.19033 Transcript_9833/m.19033 type:complete len:255 (+) Transcript_9833:2415-3179(+)